MKAIFLVFLGGVFGLVTFFAIYAWYRSWRCAIGIPVVTAAIQEYRKTHPEKFALFDASKVKAFE